VGHLHAYPGIVLSRAGPETLRDILLAFYPACQPPQKHTIAIVTLQVL
jgi:hypothetical protein